MKRLRKTNWRVKKLSGKLPKYWNPKPGTRVYLPYRRDTCFSATGFILEYKKDARYVRVGYNRPLLNLGFSRASKLTRKTFKLRDLRPAPQTISPEEVLILLSEVL